MNKREAKKLAYNMAAQVVSNLRDSGIAYDFDDSPGDDERVAEGLLEITEMLERKADGNRVRQPPAPTKES